VSAGAGRLLQAQVRGGQPAFVRGEGVELIDEHSRRYLDAASGVGNACLGYGNAEVAAAMAAQAGELQYVHGLRFETPSSRRLAERIGALAPGDLDWVFLVSGGSEANETAFKFARQYWLQRGRERKWRIIGRWPSFHGNTLATLSAGWHAARRGPHAPLLLDFDHIAAPNAYRGCPHCARGGGCTLACADELEPAIVRAGADEVAAFILEPVVGAAAAASAPPPGYLRRVREICDAYDVLLIADEVFTGFGRLGRWFGCDRLGLQPDLLVFAKGVSAGYAPLGGVVVRDALVEPFLDGSGRFEHNFTMAGHPVSAAAGLAVLDILERDRLVERVAALESRFLEGLRARTAGLDLVGDVRGVGLLAGIELVADRRTRASFPAGLGVAARAAAATMAAGVITYPCQGGGWSQPGDALLVMPPFVTTEAELAAMTDGIGRGLEALTRELRP
jgi:adenosylmethionine-8-amino-7-oxononanoate aminotransferase